MSPPTEDPLLNELTARVSALGAEVETGAVVAWRTLLRRLRLRVWREVFAGRGSEPARWLGVLAGSVGYVRTHRGVAGPAGELAAELDRAIDELELAEHAVGDRAVPGEVRRTERPASEVAVLRVLARSERFLKRSEVHDAMAPAERPSRRRVGQILASLHERALVIRQLRLTQGATEGAFYTLSEDGHAALRHVTVPATLARGFDTRPAAWGQWLEPGDAEAAPNRRPRRVFAVHGAGRTSIGQRLASFARRWASDGEDVLVVDCRLHRPTLDRHFGDAARGGLAALAVDYAEADGDAAWLRRALDDPRYVGSSDEIETLRYLPTGLGAAAPAGGAGLAEALSGLTSRFLADLNVALQSRSGMTFVYAGSGLDVAAHAATVVLADALLLAFGPDDDDLHVARTVLGSFLAREGMHSDHPSVPVVPLLVYPEGRVDLADFVAGHVAPWLPFVRGPGADRRWPGLVGRVTPEHLPIVAVPEPRLGEEPIDRQGRAVAGKASALTLRAYEILRRECARIARRGIPAVDEGFRQTADPMIDTILHPDAERTSANLMIGRLASSRVAARRNYVWARLDEAVDGAASRQVLAHTALAMVSPTLGRWREDGALVAGSVRRAS